MTVVYSDFSTVGNFVLRGQRQHPEIFFIVQLGLLLRLKLLARGDSVVKNPSAKKEM